MQVKTVVVQLSTLITLKTCAYTEKCMLSPAAKFSSLATPLKNAYRTGIQPSDRQ